jgi:hypothetical protein
MSADLLSPELALVDPQLRMRALSLLPPVEPFEFLRVPRQPARNSDLQRFEFLAEYGDAETFRRPPPVPVAAAAYVIVTLARTLVIYGLATSVIIGLVALANILG